MVLPRSIAAPPFVTSQSLADWGGKLEARGKFFFSGAEKILLKGATYGPFAPDGAGTQFPSARIVSGDLDLIAELGREREVHYAGCRSRRRRAITSCWISFEPSPINSSGASR